MLSGTKKTVAELQAWENNFTQFIECPKFRTQVTAANPKAKAEDVLVKHRYGTVEGHINATLARHFSIVPVKCFPLKGMDF